MQSITYKVPVSLPSRLWNWLNSWWAEDGAIFGFHNHPVWGMNPVRTQNNYSGNTTFATSLLMAAALLLKDNESEWKGLEQRIERSILFQLERTSPEGFIDGGFELGEVERVGLIHQVVPIIMILESLYILKDMFSDDLINIAKERIGRILLKLEDKFPLDNPGKRGVSNQEFARIWALQSYQKLFGKVEAWQQQIPWLLYKKKEGFFVTGLPDQFSSGVVRSLSDNDYIEPAEYYGLIIQPYVNAYLEYRDEAFLKCALMLARHVIRSSWVDKNGCRRFHQSYRKIKQKYIRVCEPMCISGMGFTLYALSELNQYYHDNEISTFIQECIETYKYYQHECGFFVSATGWDSEYDIAPSTAWHSHDMLFFANIIRNQLEDFWQETCKKGSTSSILIGNQNAWVEEGSKYKIIGRDQQGWAIVGSKKSDRTFIELPGWANPDSVPMEMNFQAPKLIYTDDKIYISGMPKNMKLLNLQWTY